MLGLVQARHSVRRARLWALRRVGRTVGRVSRAIRQRQVSPQGTTATPGLPSLPDPGFLDLQIQFEFNSAVILAESHPLLDQVAIALNSPRLKTLRFDIEGHTDGVGTKPNNEILSARRAQSVVAYLTSAGVPAERMRGVGKGFSELL
ncbi:MAG: OmpA family protein, partial [Betaproteobacteria bacterium]|nr:OmpA family protein [Betaproteobacteria bacterium]